MTRLKGYAEDSCGGGSCKYYSNPFIDNGMLECFHPLADYRKYLQREMTCPGFTKGKSSGPSRATRRYRKMWRKAFVHRKE